jgi:hypothetical protein
MGCHAGKIDACPPEGKISERSRSEIMAKITDASRKDDALRETLKSQKSFRSVTREKFSPGCFEVRQKENLRMELENENVNTALARLMKGNMDVEVKRRHVGDLKQVIVEEYERRERASKRQRSSTSIKSVRTNENQGELASKPLPASPNLEQSDESDESDEQPVFHVGQLVGIKGIDCQTRVVSILPNECKVTLENNVKKVPTNLLYVIPPSLGGDTYYLSTFSLPHASQVR